MDGKKLVSTWSPSAVFLALLVCSKKDTICRSAITSKPPTWHWTYISPSQAIKKQLLPVRICTGHLCGCPVAVKPQGSRAMWGRALCSVCGYFASHESPIVPWAILGWHLTRYPGGRESHREACLWRFSVIQVMVVLMFLRKATVCYPEGVFDLQ